ncbi:AMP-dependent synthetase/ligase [Nocardioides sp. Bht2]|uniref:AMP-dependent synthetase/ligase n=1 Tax=Nocardioides sp. Bht2 TaxID=3392297 RepID=UPI0039B54333
MREFSTPLAVDIPKTGNLTDDVVRNAREAGDAVLFSVRSGETWSEVTASAFHDEVAAVAKGLIASGVEAGDRVALLSRTRYEWTLADYAIWFAGAVTVPIYETSSADQVEWILQDSGATLAIVESAEHLAKVKPVQDSSPTLREVVTIDENAIEELRRRGAEITDEALEARRSTATPLDLATLIYTSGTTGRPKGCMLTHGNFMFELGVAIEELELLFKKNGASTLLFLPLAHVFARIVQIGAFKARARLGHSADIKNLVDDLGAFKPGFILAVPRVFEKVYNTASQRAEADGKGKIFQRAADIAIAYSRGVEAGKISLPVRLQHAVFDKLVYSKLRTTLGGRCEYAISGGAPLGERLGHFYRGIGLTILEGYGLTETTAALSVNLPDAVKIGTVGRPFQGTTVRVADDGELLFKGGQVFAGYWNNEDATREALADGWFHSGDVGEVDDEGFIKITGRKKEILVTAGGKNVAPTVLEDRLRSHPLISQTMVVGDGQPFIAALITIDPEYFPYWAEQNQKTGSIASLVDDDVLRAAVQGAVEEANKAVSKAESIRKFTILASDWTEEGGQLTPSLKLKRNVVMREFRDDVEALYAR